MFPPRFNLRHFMSHLAPGGYFCLYIVAFTCMLFWLPFPSHVESWLYNFVHGETTSLVIVSLIFLLVSYFVGVALRLPPVDYVDSISMEYLLHRQLLATKAIVPSHWWGRIWRWITIRSPFAIRLDQIDPVAVPLVGRLNTLPASSNNRQNDGTFVASVRVEAASHLAAHCDDSTGQQQLPKNSGAFREHPDTAPLKEWLWTVDLFPYPLWMTYKMLLNSTIRRRADFEANLWEVMLDTMGGKVSADSPTKEPFNRCKLEVTENSNRLAATVYDNEALIRMMVGFYFGLSRAAFGSFLSGMACIVLGAVAFFTGDALHSLTSCGMLLIIWTVSLAFNCGMRRQVLRNFHVLRMSEAWTVFDSYEIVCQKFSKRRGRRRAGIVAPTHAVIPTTALPPTTPPTSAGSS